MAFAATDPRAMYAIEGKDPRIIFALCFGTISSPLIHVYHSSSIYDELDEAVRVFLHSNVFVNDSNKSVCFYYIFFDFLLLFFLLLFIIFDFILFYFLRFFLFVFYLFL